MHPKEITSHELAQMAFFLVLKSVFPEIAIDTEKIKVTEGSQFRYLCTYDGPGAKAKGVFYRLNEITGLVNISETSEKLWKVREERFSKVVQSSPLSSSYLLVNIPRKHKLGEPVRPTAPKAIFKCLFRSSTQVHLSL